MHHSYGDVWECLGFSALEELLCLVDFLRVFEACRCGPQESAGLAEVLAILRQMAA
jgi:hypothetical protein